MVSVTSSSSSNYPEVDCTSPLQKSKLNTSTGRGRDTEMPYLYAQKPTTSPSNKEKKVTIYSPKDSITEEDPTAIGSEPSSPTEIPSSPEAIKREVAAPALPSEAILKSPPSQDYTEAPQQTEAISVTPEEPVSSPKGGASPRSVGFILGSTYNKEKSVIIPTPVQGSAGRFSHQLVIQQPPPERAHDRLPHCILPMRNTPSPKHAAYRQTHVIPEGYAGLSANSQALKKLHEVFAMEQELIHGDAAPVAEHQDTDVPSMTGRIGAQQYAGLKTKLFTEDRARRTTFKQALTFDNYDNRDDALASAKRDGQTQPPVQVTAIQKGPPAGRTPMQRAEALRKLKQDQTFGHRTSGRAAGDLTGAGHHMDRRRTMDETLTFIPYEAGRPQLSHRQTMQQIALTNEWKSAAGLNHRSIFRAATEGTTKRGGAVPYDSQLEAKKPEGKQVHIPFDALAQNSAGNKGTLGHVQARKSRDRGDTTISVAPYDNTPLRRVRGDVKARSQSVTERAAGNTRGHFMCTQGGASSTQEQIVPYSEEQSPRHIRIGVDAKAVAGSAGDVKGRGHNLNQSRFQGTQCAVPYDATRKTVANKRLLHTVTMDLGAAGDVKNRGHFQQALATERRRVTCAVPYDPSQAEMTGTRVTRRVDMLTYDVPTFEHAIHVKSAVRGPNPIAAAVPYEASTDIRRGLMQVLEPQLITGAVPYQDSIPKPAKRALPERAPVPPTDMVRRIGRGAGDCRPFNHPAHFQHQQHVPSKKSDAFTKFNTVGQSLGDGKGKRTYQVAPPTGLAVPYEKEGPVRAGIKLFRHSVSGVERNAELRVQTDPEFLRQTQRKGSVPPQSRTTTASMSRVNGSMSMAQILAPDATNSLF